MVEAFLNSISYRAEKEASEEPASSSPVKKPHPMVTVTKIDKDEIPEVSHNYLMRDSEKDSRRDKDRDRDKKRFGWSKSKVPLSRSGRIIKGRGSFVSFVIFKKTSGPSIFFPKKKVLIVQNCIAALSDPVSFKEQVTECNTTTLASCSEETYKIRGPKGELIRCYFKFR